MTLHQMSFPLTFSESPAVLTLEVHAESTATVVAADGELDMTTAHLLTELVDMLARPGNGRRLTLVLDLSGVTFFCADGLRALFHARRAVGSVSGRLVLRSPSPCVRRILEITGDDVLFTVDGPGLGKQADR